MIHLAFVWHMHQPYYKDRAKNKLLMPWVRLHGVKDYLYMVRLLDEFPKIRQTFNLVPSLLSQIEDYNSGVIDTLFELTQKQASALDHEEKIFILWNFFMAQWDNMINVHPRYRELLEKRGRYVSPAELGDLSRTFSTQEYLDLQVWFNLCWIDPLTAGEDSGIKALIAKGRKYTEEDKALVLAAHISLMQAIIPKYREAASAGRIELTTTPFYHPILPLLIDTEIARTAMPDNRQDFRFTRPEDAKEQVAKAVAYFEKKFGFKPRGMWPAEGSVSEAIVPVVAGEGISWIASDEEILFKSLGSFDKKENVLYRPWKINRGGKELKIIFRDKELADLVGFVYSKWDEESAVNDFVSRLKVIGASTNMKDPLVTVVLDGENAWEYYKNNALGFFRRLYAKLSAENDIKCVKVGEYLDAFPEVPELPKLFPGSWINHDFYIWIGHDEDKRAWKYLKETRDDAAGWHDIKQKNPALYAEIMEEIYIAEGSDWCWWYGDDHSSAQDEEFDMLFRGHLKKVYELAWKEVPAKLLSPILSTGKTVLTQLTPTAFIKPVIDGKISNFYEWADSCIYEAAKASSAIHRAESIVKNLYFGFDRSNLFLRLDLNIDPVGESMQGLVFEYTFINRGAFRLKLSALPGGALSAALFKQAETTQDWIPAEGAPVKAAALRIIEAAVPYASIEAGAKADINIALAVYRGENEVEKWPTRGIINITVPGLDFEEQNWNA